jgi:hypothetical protein
MKQTAVEWFAKELNNWRIKEFGEDSIIGIPQEVFDQAKEMEKEQMKIFQIDKELFTRLPIEGINCTSFNVNEHRYFATKYYIDNFKETFKSK